MKMDNLHHLFHDKSHFHLWFLNDLMRLWTLKLKVLFPTTPTQTLFSSISATFSSDSAAFSSPTLFLSMFQGWEILYNECAGKTKEVLLHFGVFVIPAAWQCHMAPFFILKVQLESHTSTRCVEQDIDWYNSSPRWTAAHALPQIKVVITLTRPGSPLYVKIFPPFYRRLLYNTQFQALLNPNATAKRKRRTVLLRIHRPSESMR